MIDRTRDGNREVPGTKLCELSCFGRAGENGRNRRKKFSHVLQRRNSETTAQKQKKKSKNGGVHIINVIFFITRKDH